MLPGKIPRLQSSRIPRLSFHVPEFLMRSYQSFKFLGFRFQASRLKTFTGLGLIQQQPKDQSHAKQPQDNRELLQYVSIFDLENMILKNRFAVGKIQQFLQALQQKVSARLRGKAFQHHCFSKCQQRIGETIQKGKYIYVNKTKPRANPEIVFM